MGSREKHGAAQKARHWRRTTGEPKFSSNFSLCQEWCAMKSRLFWWTSMSASVLLFFGQRLNALGEIIANELEHSYGEYDEGAANFSWPMKNLRRLTAAPKWPASHQTCKDVHTKMEHDEQK
jgi:hypothetical protein